MSENERYDSGARPDDVMPVAAPVRDDAPAYGYGYATPPVPWASVRTDQVLPNTGTVVVAWVLTVFTGFYLLPWAIAATRGKSDRWAIFWITFLFGWTGIGWLITLIWSCLPHRVVRLGPIPMPPGWYPQADGTHAFWDGMRWTGHRA